jgi:hypothetical protein
MKKIVKTVLVLGIAALGITPMIASAEQGKDSLSYSIKEKMVNNGIEPDAKGTVTANENIQGNSSKEKLQVSVSGLTPSTDYSLFVTANDGSGTNIDILDFTTDSKGKASLKLNRSGNGKGGSKNNPLPSDLDLTQVIQYDIIDGSGQSVLTADTTAPASLKYMVKRDLSSGGVKSKLQIKSSKGKTNFTLDNSGLEPTTDYQLAFNGSAVQTYTSDAKGKLKIQLSSAPLTDNILDLQTVELWDMANNVIVGTSTPLP